MAKNGNPTDNERVEAVIYAEIHGEDEALKRFGISQRSLYSYRERIRDPDDKLAKIFNAYKAVLYPETERPAQFFEWLEGQVREVSALFMKKAKDLDPRNPESLRALNEHMQTLLDHANAARYIANLFGVDEPSDSQHTTPSKPYTQAGWTGANTQAEA